MKYIYFLLLTVSVLNLKGQSYTSYFTGNSNNIISNSMGGVCLMGGGVEHDEAMKWFLERADGGDILVLRASGSDGYNNYFYSELGINVNSVETIVFNSASASSEDYIQQKIKNAEAIWFAGGDQWDYISYWKDTSIDSLINDGIKNRNIVIGGTSAGMAILGKFYFSAQHGTVTSSTALANPYNSSVTVDSTAFIETNYLSDVITDTHYDNRDRRGRHVVFLARILTDFKIPGKGIACNESTAVCIDPDGLAIVYGDYPRYDDFAYFIQPNCELNDMNPENCAYGNSLNWNLNQSALKVYKVPGTNEGLNTFDLNDWKTGNGGTWENWYVDNGSLFEIPGTPINCLSLSTNNNKTQDASIKIFPNPTKENINIKANSDILDFKCYDLNGKLIVHKSNINSTSYEYCVHNLNCGIYLLNILTENRNYCEKFLVE